ncbi:hypothetical protein [Floridanema aerugineum]|uniref:Glycosyltransferase n=1 Tax=Floridaenema aerugineum BLCC-F46 TaxID=3153654 RepID=A0ABV4XFF3_9CYAN
MQIISIVSGLPPAIDGVGDYALNLARQLRKDFAINTHFIVGNPKWVGADEIEGFSVSKVNDRTVSTLLSLLNKNSAPSTILLHYVCYGYALRGCPFWLINGLQRWRNAKSDRSLVTMFHETYAFGPPWTSAFWLSQVQKYLLARLAQISDRALTSKQGYAKIISQLSLGKQTQIPALAVFSNVGEPEQPPPLVERPRQLVVFGAASTRRRVYQKSLAALEHTCQELLIEEIWDIGPATGLEIAKINGVPVIALGEKTPVEISKILSSSIVGFFNYDIDYLAKSGVFAAYCAHRLLSVGISSSNLQADGLQAGKHYCLADDLTQSLSLTAGQAIADNAYTWYHNHNLAIQAKVFVGQITRNP